MNLKIFFGILLVIVIFTGVGVWYFLSQPTATLVSTDTPSVDFGTPTDRPGEAGGGGFGEGIPNEPLEPSDISPEQKIFQIADGPIAGAILFQTLRPTTTLVRYMKADSGRVFDLPLDVPGALPRAVSNTTIPGIVRTLWLPTGMGVIAQYESDQVRKTLYVGLLNATTTLSASANPAPTRIAYLPDNITDLALSPTGANVAYLLQTSSGTDGYTANADGTGSKKLFSSPLSQLLVTWPSQNNLLLQTRPAYGVLGAAFSVDTRSGGLGTLFFANGLIGIADRTFSQIIYQSVQDRQLTFVHDIARNRDQLLSFSPVPLSEKCTWSRVATSTLLCASPLDPVPANFVDLWYLGLTQVRDSLLSYNLVSGTSNIEATPGLEEGVASDMVGLSLSPDDHYLSFVKRGERSLWGIRLR